MRFPSPVTLTLAAAALFSVACSSQKTTTETTARPAPAATSPAPATPPATPPPMTPPATPPAETAAAPISDEAKAMFAANGRCAVCHGTSGHGDGPGAAALNPKPRNYSDAAWQASVTDEHLAKVIVQGGAAVGLSPLMVPNPDLANRPEIVADLVRIIRGFKGQ